MRRPTEPTFCDHAAPARRFPATFTFVVRSFTVLDGIGKTLDPRFDISEISAPYARELLLEGNPIAIKFQKDLKKRFDVQVSEDGERGSG